ncbi:MAG: hypothetical protein OXH14_17815 [Alphaproteobacteria bacterium]|nr:hypothetical protein [Alphaproteobacteria bacterium]
MTETLAERRRGRPVAEDLRRRTVAAVVEKGMSARAAGRLFDVGGDSVALWVRRFRERGHVRPDRRGGGRRSRIEGERERILRILEAQPAISMYGLRDALAAEGLEFCALTVQRFLKRHGLERKKRLARRRRKPARKDPAAGSR